MHDRTLLGDDEAGEPFAPLHGDNQLDFEQCTLAARLRTMRLEHLGLFTLEDLLRAFRVVSGIPTVDDPTVVLRTLSRVELLCGGLGR